MALHTDQWWMPQPRPPGEAHARPAQLERDLVGATDWSPAPHPIAPPMAFNVLWPLVDFTEENGATRVVPRSHLSGRQPNRAIPHPVPTIAAAVPAGIGIAFDARLWHAAGPNVGSSPRIALGTLYCAPQTRPLENYVAGLRPDVKARLDEAYLRRLGFGPWHAYGNVGDPFAALIEPERGLVGELV
jgi:ectoine hydroxylase-related dioxygenase (phytanoyl-CoA dioxygenase family)